MLTARQEKFVQDVQQRFSTFQSPASTAKMGTTICTARRAGASPSLMIAAIGAHAAKARAIIRLAEHDLCRKYLPKKPHVLIRFSGSGISNSAPFRVTSGTVTVHYKFNCASQGTGNFIADLETGNQSSLSSDDQTIANDLSAGATKVTTVYPQNVGSMYHISVNSECSWSLVARTG